MLDTQRPRPPPCATRAPPLRAMFSRHRSLVFAHSVNLDLGWLGSLTTPAILLLNPTALSSLKFPWAWRPWSSPLSSAPCREKKKQWWPETNRTVRMFGTEIN
jgi:hypothetical protein